MEDGIKVAIIGLDTSHSIEFSKRMHTPRGPVDQKIPLLQAVSCMRFETPFQKKEGLDKREEQLASWGIRVTRSFDEAIKGCHAIMLEINDPAYHLEYFKKVARLGKPVFLDKPLAGTLADARKILALAKKYRTRVMSCSSLRFARGMAEALREVPAPDFMNVYGALGKAPAGDSLIWYGVHTFEMLERAMGRGACSVFAREDASGIVALVSYPGRRQGVVELRPDYWAYGGRLQDKGKAASFTFDSTWGYYDLLLEVKDFFTRKKPLVSLDDAYEILAMMVAARKAIETGKPARV